MKVNKICVLLFIDLRQRQISIRFISLTHTSRTDATIFASRQVVVVFVPIFFKKKKIIIFHLEPISRAGPQGHATMLVCPKLL
jgi:hypothetical protein